MTLLRGLERQLFAGQELGFIDNGLGNPPLFRTNYLASPHVLLTPLRRHPCPILVNRLAKIPLTPLQGLPTLTPTHYECARPAVGTVQEDTDEAGLSSRLREACAPDGPA
jgi:hypothetical protein